mmetsp:Transcript_35197/g.81392  ORF Transcript_35197/g.81392 Transcript_35197/m.81392 type:complete len:97 (+) Transcript_35197:1817-2107(+)
MTRSMQRFHGSLEEKRRVKICSTILMISAEKVRIREQWHNFYSGMYSYFLNKTITYMQYNMQMYFKSSLLCIIKSNYLICSVAHKACFGIKLNKIF